MKKFFLVTLLIISIGSHAQRTIINGQEASPVLSWNDFRGQPDPNSPYYAFTYWYVSYKYDAYQFKGDTVKWKVNVMLELETRSWKKAGKVTDTLLKHEQSHFDIGRICALELQEKIDKTIFFRNDHIAKLSKMVEEVLDKYRKLEILYDKETDHSHNREQQWKWDEYLRKELARFKK